MCAYPVCSGQAAWLADQALLDDAINERLSNDFFKHIIFDSDDYNNSEIVQKNEKSKFEYKCWKCQKIFTRTQREYCAPEFIFCSCMVTDKKEQFNEKVERELALQSVGSGAGQAQQAAGASDPQPKWQRPLKLTIPVSLPTEQIAPDSPAN